MKQLTCGILIYVKDQVLLCHSTGNTHWDIPKGIKEEFESPLEAAIRETVEETGLLVNKLALKDLGQHSLNKRKNIHLFKLELSSLNLNKLKCTSMVERENEQPFPEVDGYQLFNKENVLNKVSKSLKKLLISTGV
jgi:8-oxo-dGTP pyrophosphatase MutT (NUDIX family)